jgi:5-methylcytosine-specific restriction enzyme subunit McrC
MLYTFEDSLPQQEQGGKHLPLLLAAVDKLNAAIQDGEVPLVSLRGDKRPFRSDLPGILSYAVTSTDPAGKHAFTITKAHFEVSHFIGTYTTKIGSEFVTLQIQPRWGDGILSYLLQYTTGIYQPPDAVAATSQQKDCADWLLVMLWKSLFNQALRRCHIPKEYRERKTNDRFFRGRLDVSRQFRENSVDQSRFACVDAPLTLDTKISRTIRHIIRLLSKPGAYPALMRDLAGYEERLAAFGVSENDVKPADIAKIRYTRLSIGYRPLMQASQAIMRRFGGCTLQNAASETPSYFIDLAELWENYLLAILQRHLPSEYRIWSPNETGGSHLLTGEKRAIRPDILIEKSGQIVAVLDAKFKNYTQIGRHKKGGVSREDLYQMGTYLYHYGRSERPILGLFVTPVPGANAANVETMSQHPLHKIGVVAFDITGGDGTTMSAANFREMIRRAEDTFAEVVRRELERCHKAMPASFEAALF